MSSDFLLVIGDREPLAWILTQGMTAFPVYRSQTAQLECDIIQERAMAGLKAARAQGKVGGRPTVMDPDKLAAARASRDRGEGPAQIARALGVSRASVYRHLAAAE